MPAEKPVEHVSVEEYLRREALAVHRHEFHDGEVLATSGSALNHVQVTRTL